MGDAAVIDADGHVLEPLVAWATLAERYRPRIETDARGLDHVVVGNEEVFVARLGTMGLPGTDVSRVDRPVPLEEARPGACEPVARVQDLDVEGIDAAVLYPTIGLGFWGLRDARAATALARAYNDWLASYCAAAPGRLFAAAMVPFQDVDAAVAELHRARALGCVAAFVRPNPCAGRSIAAPENDAFWRARRSSTSRSPSTRVCSSPSRRSASTAFRRTRSCSTLRRTRSSRCWPARS